MVSIVCPFVCPIVEAEQVSVTRQRVLLQVPTRSRGCSHDRHGINITLAEVLCGEWLRRRVRQHQHHVGGRVLMVVGGRVLMVVGDRALMVVGGRVLMV